MLTELFVLLFGLFVGHALGDFALQNNWMATYKSRHNTPNIKSARPDLIWLHVLSAHCSIHAGFTALAVLLVSNSLGLALIIGVAEFAAHWIIDFAKSESKFGFHTDQFLHYGCKVLWAVIAIVGMHVII